MTPFNRLVSKSFILCLLSGLRLWLSHAEGFHSCSSMISSVPDRRLACIPANSAYSLFFKAGAVSMLYQKPLRLILLMTTGLFNLRFRRQYKLRASYGLFIHRPLRFVSSVSASHPPWLVITAAFSSAPRKLPLPRLASSTTGCC
jgi:hypothetical protein